jgi:23S rRNA-intervening sequence protein
MAGKSHEDLVARQMAMDLTVACYELTRSLPPDERFGLVAQMRRAAVSVPAYLSEGHAHRVRAPQIAEHNVKGERLLYFEGLLARSCRMPWPPASDLRPLKDGLPFPTES